MSKLTNTAIIKKVDYETGVIEEYTETLSKRPRDSFWRTNIWNITKAYEVSENKQNKVISYIFRNIKPSDNLFISTYAKIEKETGISRQTISKIMVRLQEIKCIAKVQNGVWMINPDYTMKGDDDRKYKLIQEFSKLLSN